MVSFVDQPIGLDLMYHKGPTQTCYLGRKDVPARVTFDRETVSRSPHVFPQEHRFVELHEPTRGRRDLSPRERRRSSRSANPQPRAMVLCQKGTLRSHHCYLCPS